MTGESRPTKYRLNYILCKLCIYSDTALAVVRKAVLWRLYVYMMASGPTAVRKENNVISFALYYGGDF